MTMQVEEKHIAWWDAPKGETYRFLTMYIDNQLQANARRYTDYVRYAALYGNWETATMAQMFLTRSVPAWRTFKRLSFNVCQSTTDTVVNQRAAECPDIMGVSADGDYRQFVRAKLFTEAVRAEFKANNVDMSFPRFVQNACVFGNGYYTVERDSGELRIRRVFSPEIVVDPYDNVCDDWPHTFSHVRYINKNVLISRYPERKAEIMQAATEPSNYLRIRGDENVRVDESWTMEANGKPGKHACVISTCDLIPIEDYPYRSPPFVTLQWGLPFQGWYAQGLVDQLVGLQMEINEVLEIIHESVRLFAHPFMLIESGSNVNLMHIQDLPGRLLKYTNTKPELVSPSLLSPEIYQHLDRCYQKAYEIAGVNMYSAQAKTLPRYESSKAMRAASQNDDVRHFNFGANCERALIELGHLCGREGAILGEENDYKTRMPHSQFFRNIPWKEINYAIENFHIEIDTINKSADSIASKIQDLEDLAQLQQLSVPELRSFLLNPDIKRVLRHVTASDEYIAWVIHKLAYEEEYIEPDQFMDFATAFKECVAEYLTGWRLGMSDKARQNLMNYILKLKDNMDEIKQEELNMQAQAQAQAKMMQAPAQPQQPASNQPGSQM